MVAYSSLEVHGRLARMLLQLEGVAWAPLGIYARLACKQEVQDVLQLEGVAWASLGIYAGLACKQEVQEVRSV